MALRLDYVARETAQNLVRNPLPGVATVTTVAVALTMLAVSFLGRSGVSNAFERWNNDVSFIVYLNANATKDQIDSIGTDLRESPQVDSVSYLDAKASYEQFRKLFADDSTIVDSVKPEDLPTSYRVKPKNPDARVVQQLADSFEAKPGVYKVDFIAEAVRAVQRIAGKLQAFLLGGSIALAVASTLLIFNSIQTAVFSRRREIEVMKLVGATNSYIRIPFVLEGLIQGLIGSGLAWLAALFFQTVWRGSFSNRVTPTLFDSIRWDNSTYLWTMAIVSIIGTAVSAIVALVSTTFYLRV